ncbi:MAG: hypothetical protein M3P06_05295 [Acidobacteriota bacterium]|nr:hypothetical protein [Acidobacteriota bacterium]
MSELASLYSAGGGGECVLTQAIRECFRTNGTDWPTFAQHLGLTSNLHDLLRAIAMSTAPCVFIAGLDRVTTARDQRIIRLTPCDR